MTAAMQCNLFETSAPEPEPATALVRRWYVRCADCLDVAMVPVPVDIQAEARVDWRDAEGYRQAKGRQAFAGALCGVCGGKIGPMGYVAGDTAMMRVGFNVRCTCNTLCVDARGPNCNCKCQGKYHGWGMAGYFQIATTDEAPRIVRPGHRDGKKLLARAEEYRRAVADAEARLAGHPFAHLAALRAGGRYLSAPDWEHYRRYQDWRHALAEAKAGRTQAGRLKILEKIAR